MDRLLVGLAALLTWAVSSGILFVLCLLSVSEVIINGALVVIGACLIGSSISFALKRDAAVFVLAAGPGLVAGAIFVASMVMNQVALRST
jgi:hypothetical protein